MVTTQRGALHAGLLFLPELAGALIAAVALGRVLETRYLQYLPLIGMAFLAAGTGVLPDQAPLHPGAGAPSGRASPGWASGPRSRRPLFGAGFSLPATSLQRVFAMVELLRGVAAFMIAPIFIHFAATVGGSAAAGTRDALWISLGVIVGGTAVALFLYFAGGARPRDPEMTVFLNGDGPGWPSPPLLARLRAEPGT